MIAGLPTYDLAIAYRVYPKVSKPALGLPLGDDKYRLSELCLRSLRDSLGALRVKLWAILDGCPPEYEELFRRYFPPGDLEVVKLESVGNLATFSCQIDILLNQQVSDFVYFAEDDYLYLPGRFPSMLEFLRQNRDADFVSPYDHLDCYTLDLHSGPKWIRTSAGQHWRTAASTCLTFLARREALLSYENAFRSYAIRNFDCSLWLSLTKHRVFDFIAMTRYFFNRKLYWKILLKAWYYGWKQILFGRKATLWIPIPAIATHLDSKALSPNVDWCDRICKEPEYTTLVEAKRIPSRSSRP